MKYMRSILSIIFAFFLLGASQAQELKPNDSIVLTARGMPDGEILNGIYNIDSNGILIGLPYLEGIQIRAAGVTPAQLASRIASAYINNEIYTRPSFTVSTGEGDRATEVYVTAGGEVNRQGDVLWRHGMNLQMAIASAGGRSQFASWKVLVHRDTGEIFEVDIRTPEGARFVVEPRDYIEVWEDGITGPKPPSR